MTRCVKYYAYQILTVECNCSECWDERHVTPGSRVLLASSHTLRHFKTLRPLYRMRTLTIPFFLVADQFKVVHGGYFAPCNTFLQVFGTRFAISGIPRTTFSLSNFFCHFRELDLSGSDYSRNCVYMFDLLYSVHIPIGDLEGS